MRAPKLLLLSAIFLTATVHFVAADSKSWKPDPVWLPTLAEPVKLSAFSVRPPQGFWKEDKPAHGPMSAVEWVFRGPRRSDNTQATLTVSEIPLPAQYRTESALMRIARESSKSVSANFRDWKCSAIEKGTLGGKSFVRTYWTGVQKDSNQKFTGFLYQGLSGPTLVSLISTTRAEYKDADLPMAETAARTFTPLTK